MHRLFPSKLWSVVLLSCALVAIVWMFLHSDEASKFSSDFRPTGAAQLVSISPLPQAAESGEMCEWVPASAGLTLREKIEETVTDSQQNKSGGLPYGITIPRKPLRTIRDQHPTFSAVAVDVQNNEIVLQDENLFQIMVYDRMTDTPPTASFSEPKRVIGGHNTKSEFNCGLYIDPQSGDIYSVNNDTLDTLSIFARSAKGNVAPNRELHTPHRTYGIAVDEASGEMFLTVQDPPMVVVYHKQAKGDDRPIRVLRGNHTGMADVHGIGLDTKNGLMAVANFGSTSQYQDGGGSTIGTGTRVETMGTEMTAGSGKFFPPSIAIFPIRASGDTPALRTISGPKTMLNWPSHVYVDSEHGEIFVANDGDNSIVVFRVTDDGDVAPFRVLKGPKTEIKNPTGVFVDVVHNELMVASMGSHSASVFRRDAEGDTAPLRRIRNAPLGKSALMIGNPGSVAYDTKRNVIITPN